MTKKKCYCCDNTTDKNLDDFHEIDWTAFKLPSKKTRCFCPNCQDKFMREATNVLLNTQKRGEKND